MEDVIARMKPWYVQLRSDSHFLSVFRVMIAVERLRVKEGSLRIARVATLASLVV